MQESKFNKKVFTALRDGFDTYTALLDITMDGFYSFAAVDDCYQKKSMLSEIAWPALSGWPVY